MNDELKQSGNPFSFKGVVSRGRFFMNHIWIGSIISIPAVLLVAALSRKELSDNALFGFTALVISPLIFFNNLKRIRDILGKNEESLKLTLLMMSTIFLPVIAIILTNSNMLVNLTRLVYPGLHFMLLLWPGKITSPPEPENKEDEESNIDYEVDLNQDEIKCPACNTVFKTQDTCPDCGLYLGVSEEDNEIEAA